jgi:cytoskeleton protein RodZ
MADAVGIADLAPASVPIAPVPIAPPAPASAPYTQDTVSPSAPEPVEPAANLAAVPAPSEAPVEPTDTAPALTTPGEAAAIGEDQSQDEVVLEFHGPCWVDVRDAAKTFSLTGSMAKGDRRVLGGTPPYSLVLGSTSAVTVTVKGVPFDLSPVSKGNVARFKLDPAALP